MLTHTHTHVGARTRAGAPLRPQPRRTWRPPAGHGRRRPLRRPLLGRRRGPRPGPHAGGVPRRLPLGAAGGRRPLRRRRRRRQQRRRVIFRVAAATAAIASRLAAAGRPREAHPSRFRGCEACPGDESFGSKPSHAACSGASSAPTLETRTAAARHLQHRLAAGLTRTGGLQAARRPWLQRSPDCSVASRLPATPRPLGSSVGRTLERARRRPGAGAPAPDRRQGRLSVSLRGPCRAAAKPRAAADCRRRPAAAGCRRRIDCDAAANQESLAPPDVRQSPLRAPRLIGISHTPRIRRGSGSRPAWVPARVPFSGWLRGRGAGAQGRRGAVGAGGPRARPPVILRQP